MNPPSLAAVGTALLFLLACGRPPWSPDGDFGEPPAASGRGFLHADGTALVDGKGDPLTLKAINVGGWLNWEAWIWGGGWQREGEIAAELADLVGAEEAARFRSRVYQSFFTEEDIARIAQLGFNAVRVAFNHNLLEDDAAPFS